MESPHRPGILNVRPTRFTRETVLVTKTKRKGGENAYEI